MTESFPNEHEHRRDFLRISLTTAFGLVGNISAAPATIADDPLPDGVLRQYGTPWFRSPSAVGKVAFPPDS